MTETETETPLPLRQVASGLSERAEALAGQVAEANSRVTAPAIQPGSRPKVTVPGVSRGTDGGLSDVMVLRQGAAFRAVSQAAAEVTAALAVTLPEELPDDPADLEGSDLSRVLLASDLLASLDAERDADGHLTSPSAKETYGRWAQHRDDLEPVVRQHLGDLQARLDGAADKAAPYLLPEPPEAEAPPERHGTWLL